MKCDQKYVIKSTDKPPCLLIKFIVKFTWRNGKKKYITNSGINRKDPRVLCA